MLFTHLEEYDAEVFQLIKQEEEKQANKLSMIPSENFTLPAVREALASVFVHKYAEGQINKRYYEGNQYVDALDVLCKNRIKKAFSLSENWNINIQALAGSNANLGVYNALLNPGDTILSMYLPDGGHLSHGWSYPEKDEKGLGGQIYQNVYLGGKRKVSFVSRVFNVIQYKVEPKSRLFNYNEIRKIALKYNPRLIISGGTAYPREIAYEELAKISKEVGAYYLADVSHEAGLIAAGVNKSPVGCADVITFTTHKTLRGPRGAIVISKSELSERIDSGIFPGLQGGPFEHTIASIAVCLKDVISDSFKEYAKQVIKNAQRLASNFLDKGYDVVTGGTDKHLILIDLRNKNISGRIPAKALDLAGIIVNKNSVPNETGSPMNPSGIRLGTPTITTRGMKENEMDKIAKMIDEVITKIIPFCNLKNKDFYEKAKNIDTLKNINQEVKDLCKKFPLEM